MSFSVHKRKGSKDIQDDYIIDRNGDVCWEVESILDKKYSRSMRTYQYLIKWKGFGMKEVTWETIDNLDGALEMLLEFEKNYAEIVAPVESALFTNELPKKARAYRKSDIIQNSSSLLQESPSKLSPLVSQGGQKSSKNQMAIEPTLLPQKSLGRSGKSPGEHKLSIKVKRKNSNGELGSSSTNRSNSFQKEKDQSKTQDKSQIGLPKENLSMRFEENQGMESPTIWITFEDERCFEEVDRVNSRSKQENTTEESKRQDQKMLIEEVTKEVLSPLLSRRKMSKSNLEKQSSKVQLPTLSQKSRAPGDLFSQSKNLFPFGIGESTVDSNTSLEAPLESMERFTQRKEDSKLSTFSDQLRSSENSERTPFGETGNKGFTRVGTGGLQNLNNRIGARKHLTMKEQLANCSFMIDVSPFNSDAEEESPSKTQNKNTLKGESGLSFSFQKELSRESSIQEGQLIQPQVLVLQKVDSVLSSKSPFEEELAGQKREEEKRKLKKEMRKQKEKVEKPQRKSSSKEEVRDRERSKREEEKSRGTGKDEMQIEEENVKSSNISDRLNGQQKKTPQKNGNAKSFETQKEKVLLRKSSVQNNLLNGSETNSQFSKTIRNENLLHQKPQQNPNGNFKEDKAMNIEFLSCNGVGKNKTGNYLFKVLWKPRANGVQKEPTVVQWETIKKEAPQEISRFSLDRLVETISKLGAVGQN